MIYLRRVQKEHQNVTVIHQDVMSGNTSSISLSRMLRHPICYRNELGTGLPDWENVAIQMMHNDRR